MTVVKINKRMESEMDKLKIKFDAAVTIRKVLDEARKAYGATEWVAEDLQTEILELATEDE